MAVAVPAWEVDDAADYRALTRARLENVVPVSEPLVLISQIQRSGGTLLLQLLDGHPECHVDPFELKIGHPKKHNWPPIDLSQPETLVRDSLFPWSRRAHPAHRRTRRPGRRAQRVPVPLLAPAPEGDLRCAASPSGAGERAGRPECYFTSYFNAWLDNQ